MTFIISILDNNRKHVGDLQTATMEDIKNLLNKGMIVINQMDGTEITMESLNNMIGVSDGLITV